MESHRSSRGSYGEDFCFPLLRRFRVTEGLYKELRGQAAVAVQSCTIMQILQPQLSGALGVNLVDEKMGRRTSLDSGGYFAEECFASYPTKIYIPK